MLTALPVNTFSDNYVWLVSSTNAGADDGTASSLTCGEQGLAARVVIVDPGESDPVVSRLEESRLAPSAILITHHHYDHVGGLQALSARYRIPVYGPAHENIPGVTHPLAEGTIIELPIGSFRVLEVPGHTLGHIAFYGEESLFCGDTLFAGGCGRLFEGTPAQMYNSLTKFAGLPDETAIYCAHEYTEANLEFALLVEPGNIALRERHRHTVVLRQEGLPTVPSTLALEKQTNPFLRCEVPAVIAAASEFANRPLRAGAEVFQIVRYWKDTCS